jgi:hypothetical protein
MIQLRGWALCFLGQLGDSDTATQAILIGERLVADREFGVLGPTNTITIITVESNMAAYSPRPYPETL